MRPTTSGDGGVRIESLALSKLKLQSGERTRIRLDCAVRENGWAEPENVRLRVRSTQTGDVLFETGTMQLGLELPQSGAYALDFDLQMNVARGVYLIESYVWDRLMGRESFAGPSAHLDVRGGDEFDGLVQMHPQVRLAEANVAIVSSTSASGKSTYESLSSDTRSYVSGPIRAS